MKEGKEREREIKKGRKRGRGGRIQKFTRIN